MSTATTHRYDTSRYRAPAGLTEHSPALLRFTIANPPSTCSTRTSTPSSASWWTACRQTRNCAW